MRQILFALAISSIAFAAPVTITFEHAMTGPNQKALEGLVQMFEQSHPEIHVQLIGEGGYTALDVKLLAQIAAGSPPTLAQMYPTGATNYILGHQMIPLDRFLRTDPTLLHQLYPAMLASGRYPNGEIWLLPFNKSDIVLYYNRTLFSRLGLQPPKSWKDLEAICATIKAQAHIPCLADGFGNDTFEAFVNSTGAPFLTDQEEVPAFAENGSGVKVLTFWRSLITRGYAILTSGFANQLLFGTEKAAMTTASIADLPYIAQAVGSRFSFGVAPLPAGPDGHAQIYTKLYGSDVGIFGRGPNATPAQQQAAWTFLQFLLSPQAQAYWVEHTGYLPVNREATKLLQEQGYFSTPEGKAKLVAIAELAHAKPDHFSGWFDQFAWRNGSVLPALIQQVLKGELTPTEAMKQAVAKALELSAQEGDWLYQITQIYKSEVH
jgi:multiple sugar transport system substrate-binding protein